MRRISKQKNSIFLKFWIAGIILFLILFAFLFFKSGIFNVKEVEVAGKGIDCVNLKQIIDSSQIKGKNIFLFDATNLIKNIKEKFVCVKEVFLFKSLFSKVKIEITGRQPAAKLVVLKGEEASASSFLENIATPSATASEGDFLIDSEGVIFSKDTNAINVPIIFHYDQSLSLSKSLKSGNAQNALKIFNKVKTFGLNVNSAIILNESFIVFSSPKIIFRLDNNIDTQIASLQLILEKAKIDEGSMEFIDLRFDKPIIRSTPKKNG